MKNDNNEKDGSPITVVDTPGFESEPRKFTARAKKEKFVNMTPAQEEELLKVLGENAKEMHPLQEKERRRLAEAPEGEDPEADEKSWKRPYRGPLETYNLNKYMAYKAKGELEHYSKEYHPLVPNLTSEAEERILTSLGESAKRSGGWQSDHRFKQDKMGTFMDNIPAFDVDKVNQEEIIDRVSKSSKRADAWQKIFGKRNIDIDNVEMAASFSERERVSKGNVVKRVQEYEQKNKDALSTSQVRHEVSAIESGIKSVSKVSAPSGVQGKSKATSKAADKPRWR